MVEYCQCTHQRFQVHCGFWDCLDGGRAIGASALASGWRGVVRCVHAVVIHAHCGGFESGHMQAGRQQEIVWTAAQCCAHKD